MNPQLREELEHEMGRATEQQNAFALAQMQYAAAGKFDNDPRIEQETAKGKFVVVVQGEVCCPHTDALMACPLGFISAHDTREEALAVTQVQGYEPLYVLPQPPPEGGCQNNKPLNDDDIPF
jgi:hypothetical protein